MAANAAEIYFAEIADGPVGRRAWWHRGLDFLISLIVEHSVGPGGGHVVAVRPRANPTAVWLELGPLTRRDARGMLRIVQDDLAVLTQAEFETKYRLRHEPTLPVQLPGFDM